MSWDTNYKAFDLSFVIITSSWSELSLLTKERVGNKQRSQQLTTFPFMSNMIIWFVFADGASPCVDYDWSILPKKWLDNDKKVQILPHTPHALKIFLDTKIPVCHLLGPILGGVWESTHKIGELAIFAKKKVCICIIKKVTFWAIF